MKTITSTLIFLLLTTLSLAQYIEKQKIIAADGAASDWFGQAIEFSGDGSTMIVGALYDNDPNLKDCGSAYIFVRQGNAWVQQAKLYASDKQKNARFGRSVALSGEGNFAMIGRDGAVYCFKRTGCAWQEIWQLKDTYVGGAVDLSYDGKTAIIAAPGRQIGNNTLQGEAMIFKRKGNVWTLNQNFTANDGSSNDHFGVDVKLSADGKTAVIGAYGGNAAYIFKNKAGIWTQFSKLLPPDPEITGQWGFDVTLSANGKTAAVLGYTGLIEDPDYLLSPSIFVEQEKKWIHQAKLTPDDAVPFDYYSAISISAFGNVVVFGQDGKTVGTNEGQGMIHVFKRTNGSWSETQRLTYSNGVENDNFGNDVAITPDAKTVAGGAVEYKSPGFPSIYGPGYVVTFDSAQLLQQSALSDIKANTNGKMQLHVFPNPAKDQITVSLNNADVKRLFIINANGSVAKEITVISKSITINIQDLKPGVHFIRIINENNEIMAVKFLKE
jgi:hypothetical protein